MVFPFKLMMTADWRYVAFKKPFLSISLFSNGYRYGIGARNDSICFSKKTKESNQR
jgi:hypothetical protein